MIGVLRPLPLSHTYPQAAKPRKRQGLFRNIPHRACTPSGSASARTALPGGVALLRVGCGRLCAPCPCSAHAAVQGGWRLLPQAASGKLQGSNRLSVALSCSDAA